MNVTFVATHAWPAIGGTETFLGHLSRELARRHNVRILALSIVNEPSHRLRESLLPPPAFEAFVDAGVAVEHLVIRPARRALLAPLVGQVVPGLRRYAWSDTLRGSYARIYARVVAPVIAERAEGADIIHHWGIGLLGVASEQAARLADVPSAITPFVHRAQWGDDPTSVATYRRYTRVFALLEAEADFYREKGVDHVEVCGVCNPGVPAGGGAELRRAHGIEHPLVLFLGERRGYKGHDLLAEVATRLPDATFVFAGPGPSVAGENVIDAGVVDDDERAAWLDAADLLCLPSEAEILPSVFLEGWSVRTPFLTTDIPPLRELALSGGGFVVERTVGAIAARLRDLFAAPTQLRTAGDRGYSTWTARYTPAAVAGAYESVYASIARSTSATA